VAGYEPGEGSSLGSLLPLTLAVAPPREEGEKPKYMQPNRVKQKLQAGGRAFGTFAFEFATSGISRLAAAAGAEFLIYDMEHTGWSHETIKQLIASSRGTELTTLVRVPATEYHFCARALDMGASGIMAPMVESAEQAERLVQYCKYPPVGRRGSAFSIAHDDYRGGSIVEKIASANSETLLLAQIETKTGLEQVDAIAAVEGIDVLWVGQFDLSNFLGMPGQFDHPTFLSAIERVAEAARTHSKIAGVMVLSEAEGRAWLDQGYRMMSYSGDLWIYQAALKAGLAGLRKHAETKG
jgi:2-keto-3-deoxy-L-rhamnonate aldolase RhmA